MPAIEEMQTMARSPAATRHQRPGRLDHVGGGEEIEVHHPRPLRRGFLPRGHGRAAADIADEDVEPAPLLFDVLNKACGGGGIGDVGNVNRVPPADGRARGVQRIGAACRKRDLGAFCRERCRDCKPDPAAGAGDESDAIVQL
ncbi:hypothetical protein ACVWZK_004179 [Bradyrhizobium sp. GM0.4]